MTRPVVHFEIHGKDGAKLQEFYKSLFGWEIDANNPMQYGMVTPGIGGPPDGVGGGITSSEAAPKVTIYVQVVSLDETLAKAESMGGETGRPPMGLPGGPEMAQVPDPEGHGLGLRQQSPRSRPEAA